MSISQVLGRLLLAVLLAALALVAYVGSKQLRPDTDFTSVTESGDSQDLTVDDVKNATYDLHRDDPQDGEPVTLSDGEYIYRANEGTDYAFTLSSKIWEDDSIALGDLNGDGIKDAATILYENRGGTGHFAHLVALISEKGEARHVATTYIDDRPQVESIAITDGTIYLVAIVHGEKDGACCPTLYKEFSFNLEGENLREVSVLLSPSPEEGKAYRNNDLRFELVFPAVWEMNEGKTYIQLFSREPKDDLLRKLEIFVRPTDNPVSARAEALQIAENPYTEVEAFRTNGIDWRLYRSVSANNERDCSLYFSGVGPSTYISASAFVFYGSESSTCTENFQEEAREVIRTVKVLK